MAKVRGDFSDYSQMCNFINAVPKVFLKVKGSEVNILSENDATVILMYNKDIPTERLS